MKDSPRALLRARTHTGAGVGAQCVCACEFHGRQCAHSDALVMYGLKWGPPVDVCVGPADRRSWRGAVASCARRFTERQRGAHLLGLPSRAAPAVCAGLMLKKVSWRRRPSARDASQTPICLAPLKHWPICVDGRRMPKSTALIDDSAVRSPQGHTGRARHEASKCLWLTSLVTGSVEYAILICIVFILFSNLQSFILSEGHRASHETVQEHGMLPSSSDQEGIAVGCPRCRRRPVFSLVNVVNTPVLGTM